MMATWRWLWARESVARLARPEREAGPRLMMEL